MVYGKYTHKAQQVISVSAEVMTPHQKIAAGSRVKRRQHEMWNSIFNPFISQKQNSWRSIISTRKKTNKKQLQHELFHKKAVLVVCCHSPAHRAKSPPPGGAPPPRHSHGLRASAADEHFQETQTKPEDTLLAPFHIVIVNRLRFNLQAKSQQQVAGERGWGTYPVHSWGEDGDGDAQEQQQPAVSEHESVNADPSAPHCADAEPWNALMRSLPQTAQSCVVLSLHGPAHAYSKLQSHSAGPLLHDCPTWGTARSPPPTSVITVHTSLNI